MLLRKLCDYLYRVSSWKTIILSIAVYALFLTQVMAPHAQEMNAFAGTWGAPDGHLFYTPDELYGHIAEWGNAGRRHYVEFRMGLDPLWALTYTAFLVTISGVALRRAFPGSDPRRLLIAFPLLPMCADLLENTLGIAIMLSYPDRLDWLAWLAAATSSIKWVSLGLAHLLMLYALACAAFNTRRRDPEQRV